MLHQLMPDEFAFSQSSLQAYSDCARRFWLAYVRQLVWPAVEATPVTAYEQTLRDGALFHRLLERAEIGIDPMQLSQHLEYPLSLWFESYLRHRPSDLPETVTETERILSIPFQIGHDGQPTQAVTIRLAAKYDLISIEPGERAVIVDWKTSHIRPEPARMRDRWQTLIYQFVLVEASRGLPWGPIEPEQVEMRYWYTAEPEAPIRFRYSRPQHDEVHAKLTATISHILAGFREEDFPKVPDTEANRRRFCNYCIYRSLCDRGEKAGTLEQTVDAEDIFDPANDDLVDFSLEDIDELAF